MEDPPSFFEFILRRGDLQKLGVNPEFAKDYGNTFSDHVYLRDPRGLEHKVELKKSGDNIWFINGWKEFAKSYSLGFGDFLAFFYQGNSRFNVRIYDESSCEITYPVFDTQSAGEDDDDEDVVEVDEEEFDSNEEEQSWDEEEHGEEDSEEEQSRDSTTRGKGKEKMSQACQKAEAFQCDNPSFNVVMRKTYVDGHSYVRVPTRYAKSYLKDVTKLELQLGAKRNGVTWTVKIIRSCSGIFFSAGWGNFVHDLQLEFGDVCKFELVDYGTHTHGVHIFRHD